MMRIVIAIAILLTPALALAGGAGVAAAVTFVGKLIGSAKIGAAIAAAAFTFFVSKASSMMSKEGGVDSFGQGRTQTVRQEAAPRQIIYGETRVGGVYTFMRVTDDNRYLHMVITLSGHELNNIGDVYYDGEVMQADGGDIISNFRGERDSGNVSVVNGKFQTPVPVQTSDINLGGFRRGTIVNVSGMANSANNGDHRITDLVKDNAANEVRMSVESTLINEDETAATFQADYVKINKHTGADNQAADSDLERLIDDWTEDHRQQGCAYIYVRVRWNRDKWPTGIPNFSAVVQGKNDIYDPRDGSTGYSTNPALCIADFLTWDRYGFNADYATEINEEALKESAGVCDECVDLANSKCANGGGETRYTINGAMSSGTKIAPNLNAMMGSMAGEVIWSGGQWYILAGYYRTPSVTFDESDLTGGLSVITGISRSDLFNAVKGTYIGPENRYIEAGFPAVTNATYVSNDGGEKTWENIELPFTDSPSMAQRIAKIQLEQVRQQITVSMPVNLKGLQVKAGDVVQVTNARMGWTDKPFEITNWELALDSQDESPIFGVNLELRETASGVYDWNSGEETTVDLAPDTALPDAFKVTAPTNFTVKSGTPQLYVKKDGTIVSRIRLDWTSSADSFVREYEVQYKRSSDTEWEPSGKPEDDDSQWYIWDVEDDVDYDVRIRAINPFLVRSDWVTVSNHTVVGKTDPPPDPDEFEVLVQADGTREFDFSMTNTPADLAGFEVRYIAGSSTDWDTMNTLTPQGRLAFSPFESNQVGAGLHSFGVKAVDTSGNYSTGALFIEQDLPNPRLSGVLLQRKERQLQWPGTLNSMFRDSDNVLRAVAATGGTWDDLSGTAWSAATTWLDWTTRESPVSYETPIIDLGSDAIFTPRVTISATGTTTIEMKTGTEADGSVAGSYVAIDDVEGARYVQIRVTITGTTPELASMVTLIDGDVETTAREDINTATNTESWFNRIGPGHFQVAANDATGAVTRATITALQGITTRHWWSLESKTATVNGNPAAEFKVYDETDTLADVTVDVELKGPKGA